MTQTTNPVPRAEHLTRHLASVFAGTRFYAHQRTESLHITWFNGPVQDVVRRTLARHLAAEAEAGAEEVTVQRKLRANTMSEARRIWLTLRREEDEYGWRPAITTDGILIPPGPPARQIRRIAEQVVLCDPPTAVDPAAGPSPWTIAIAALLRDAAHHGADLDDLCDEVDSAAGRIRRDDNGPVR